MIRNCFAIEEKNFKFSGHFDTGDTSPKVNKSRCNGFMNQNLTDFSKYTASKKWNFQNLTVLEFEISKFNGLFKCETSASP